MGAFMTASPFPYPPGTGKFEIHRIVRDILGRNADSFGERESNCGERYHAWAWHGVTRQEADAVGDRLGTAIFFFRFDPIVGSLEVACKPHVAAPSFRPCRIYADSWRNQQEDSLRQEFAPLARRKRK